MWQRQLIINFNFNFFKKNNWSNNLFTLIHLQKWHKNVVLALFLPFLLSDSYIKKKKENTWKIHCLGVRIGLSTRKIPFHWQRQPNHFNRIQSLSKCPIKEEEERRRIIIAFYVPFISTWIFSMNLFFKKINFLENMFWCLVRTKKIPTAKNEIWQPSPDYDLFCRIRTVIVGFWRPSPNSNNQILKFRNLQH